MRTIPVLLPPLRTKNKNTTKNPTNFGRCTSEINLSENKNCLIKVLFHFSLKFGRDLKNEGGLGQKRTFFGLFK